LRPLPEEEKRLSTFVAEVLESLRGNGRKRSVRLRGNRKKRKRGGQAIVRQEWGRSLEELGVNFPFEADVGRNRIKPASRKLFQTGGGKGMKFCGTVRHRVGTSCASSAKSRWKEKTSGSVQTNRAKEEKCC